MDFNFNNIKHNIESISDKKLVGKKLVMNLLNNKTKELWSSFMPKRNLISNIISNNLYSIQVYEKSYFLIFNPSNNFEKWATIEVDNFDNIPTELECFDLTGGLYAVFNYKGLSSDTRIFQYIFNDWLPNSIYELDNRPHFEILGEKYKNNDSDSEEEIWIPIKNKIFN